MLLSKAIAMVDTPEGRARLIAYLDTTPFPHFEPHPTIEGALIRVETDGRKVTGKFVGREFVALR